MIQIWGYAESHMYSICHTKTFTTLKNTLNFPLVILDQVECSGAF